MSESEERDVSEALHWEIMILAVDRGEWPPNFNNFNNSAQGNASFLTSATSCTNISLEVKAH